MARLSKERWEYLRNRWEGDPRAGFDWLANELNGDVSRQAISKMAKKEGWSKGGVKVAQQTSCATKKKVAQPKQKPKNLPVKAIESAQPELEEVYETPIRLHGNSKYDQRFDEQAYKLCLLGATDEELGDFFGVTEQTINNWKRDYPSFFESLSKGKVAADAEVAASLFKRARGFRYSEVRTKEILSQEEDADGNMIDGELKAVEIVSTVKEVPPDTGAAFLWLKNRRGKDWKDKQEIEINNQLGPELLSRLESDMMKRMEAARDRQKTVLLERGIVAEQ